MAALGVLTADEFVLAILHGAGSQATESLAAGCWSARQAVARAQRRLCLLLPRVVFVLGGKRPPYQMAPVRHNDGKPEVWTRSAQGCLSGLITGQLLACSSWVEEEGGRAPGAAERGLRHIWVGAGMAPTRALRPTLSHSQDVWRSLPTVPQPAWGAAAAALEGQLYLCGGWEECDDDVSSTTEVFDPEADTWQPLPPPPPQLQCRIWEAAGIRAHQLYVCSPWRSRPVHLEGGWIYDRHNGRWAEQISDSCLEVMGDDRPGESNEVPDGCLGSARASRFDARSGCWESLPTMVHARAEPAVGVLRGRLYACGGIGRGGCALCSAERFDPEAGLWELLPPMPMPRAWAAAAAFRGCLYVCGGLGPDEQPVGGADCYNPDTDSWESVQESRGWRTELATVMGGFTMVS